MDNKGNLPEICLAGFKQRSTIRGYFIYYPGTATRVLAVKQILYTVLHLARILTVIALNFGMHTVYFWFLLTREYMQ